MHDPPPANTSRRAFSALPDQAFTMADRGENRVQEIGEIETTRT